MTKKKISKKVVKKEQVSKKVASKKNEVGEKNFVVIYNGVAGKKAVSEKNAVDIAKEYIADKKKKCKKADVYQFVKKVE